MVAIASMAFRERLRLRDLGLPLALREASMTEPSFLIRCHSHMLGEDGRVELEQCRALANDMAELKSMGIILTLVGSYAVGPHRYTSLKDALAEVRRSKRPSDDR